MAEFADAIEVRLHDQLAVCHSDAPAMGGHSVGDRQESERGELR